MRHFLFLLFLVSSFTIAAQPEAGEYIDVVFLNSGEEYVGTIVDYAYGKRVSLVEENGNLKLFKWENVRRVNFKLDKDRLQQINSKERNRADEAPDTPGEPVFTPERTWRHQVTGAINLGQSGTAFGRGITTIGGGFAYHAVKEISFLQVGGGLDLSLMSDNRDENIASVTLFAEAPIAFRYRHIRPIVRLEAGPGLPFGTSNVDGEITNRQLGLLVHPSVGLEIQPRDGQWGGLVFDIGYRFLDTKFTVLTPNLDELERTLNYRRLVFRGGIRF